MQQVNSPHISRLIGTVHLLLGVMILLIYVLAVLLGGSMPLLSTASAVIILFIASAVLQRIFKPTVKVGVWAIAALDLVLLLVLIWSNVGLYGGLMAAALKSPSYGFLFALIALQALRQSPALILCLGSIAAGGHLVMFMLAVKGGADLTSSYTWYQSSSSLMVAGEGELLVALILFTL